MARILVVDDEPDLRAVIAMILDRVGHDVVTVADGASAIEMPASEDIDLIVTDLVMPDIDGIQVTRAVRASAMSRTPILLVTASATPLSLRHTRQALTVT